MRKTLHLKCRHALSLFSLYAVLSSAAHAQVSFVQITDLHIFDAVNQMDDNRLGNKAAFASCIEKINRMASERGAENGTAKVGPYDFVIVTGDLGIEHLLKGVDEREGANKIRAGAIEVASMIAVSKVQTWLFVPGNDDLLDEKPESISYYYEFLAAFREAVAGVENKINVADLCAEGASGIPYRGKDYAFICFNNASFRNSVREADAAADGALPIDKNFDAQ